MKKRESFTRLKGSGGEKFRDFAAKGLMRRIAMYLAMGYLPREISAEVRVHTKSIRRILQRPDFAVIYQEVETEIYSALERKIRHLLVAAINRLEKLVKSPDPAVAERNIDRVLKLNNINLDEVKPLVIGALQSALQHDIKDAHRDQRGYEDVKGAMDYLRATNGALVN